MILNWRGGRGGCGSQCSLQPLTSGVFGKLWDIIFLSDWGMLLPEIEEGDERMGKELRCMLTQQGVKTVLPNKDLSHTKCQKYPH